MPVGQGVFMKKLIKEDIEKCLSDLNVVVPVRCFDVLDSTNETVKKCYDETGEHCIVAACVQTGGKGRNGRSFISEQGGAYFSFSFSLGAEELSKQLYGSVMLSALAVVSVMEEFGIESAIKWPNDVIADGKKLCGILSEVVYDKGYPDRMIVGIGINVNNDLAPEIKDIATSMTELTGSEFLIAEVIARVVRRFFEMLTDKDYDVRENYLKNCLTLGQNVKVSQSSGEYYAFAEDLDENGLLIVRTSDGMKKTVTYGDVTIRPVYS